MKDLRSNIFYKFFQLGERILSKIKYILFEKNRFIIAKNPLLNNYVDVMISNFKRVGFKEEDVYERQLFLQLFLTHIFYLFKNDAYIKLLDYGGGIGGQAIYLNKNCKIPIEIDVLEQDELVDHIKASENYHLFTKRSINFIKSSELEKKEYDCAIFNGSLSYIDKPLTLLQNKTLGNLIGISRFPISADIESSLSVFDSFGSHFERIHSQKFIDEIKKHFNFLFCEYNVLPKSKTKIKSLVIKSINLIIKKNKI